MIRAVLDTNVLVSAAITPRGHSDQIVGLAERGAFEWLTCEFILDELANVLGRRHIQSKYTSQVTARRQDRYLASIREFAELVIVTTELVAVRDDPKDDVILACAKDGAGDYIVTGDRHLLALGAFEGIEIVTPAQFLKIQESEI